jgi:phenylalanyl-tRNA synthetase beta chain
LRTLDGIERALPPGTCVIADAVRGLAIGGIMGGAESEISFATRDILIESAWFDPISIRRASKLLGLRTEASLRFERGADPQMADFASQRCASLIAELAGGDILAGVIDVYPGRREPLPLTLSRRELLRIIGADVPDSEIEAILDSLGFSPRRVNGDVSQAAEAVWQCVQPSWRQDVTREVDLIEEVVRHYGLDRFPARLHAWKQPSARLPHAEAEDRLRERLIGLGYHEIVSIPLVNAEEDALFRAPGAQPATISNPLAADASVLRSTGLISMARAIAWNLNRGQRNVRLFEIGRAYGLAGTVPTEQRILTVGATGLAREKSVVEESRAYDFADLKGDLDSVGELARGFTWQHATPPLPWQDAAHAGHFGIVADTTGTSLQPIGAAAQLSQRVADELKLRQNLFMAELALDPFYSAVLEARKNRRYRPLSRFPAVERDFALVVPDGTSFAAVRDAIYALGIPEIVSVEPVDIFRGKQLQPGTFSMLVRVTLQSFTGTLTESQTSSVCEKILSALAQQLHAALRSS